LVNTYSTIVFQRYYTRYSRAHFVYRKFEFDQPTTRGEVKRKKSLRNRIKQLQGQNVYKMIRFVAKARRFQQQSNVQWNYSLVANFNYRNVPPMCQLRTFGGMVFRCKNTIPWTSYPYTINNSGYSLIRQLRIVENLTIAVAVHGMQQERQFYTNPNGEPMFGGSIVEQPKEKKKKKKKKKKPKKEIPVMDSKEVWLEKMNMRFEEIEKEHLSPNRGVRTVKWIAGLKCEGLHKTVTTAMANSMLNSWVYCRHALRHGFYQLNDMTKRELAESILGKGTKVKVADRDARIILKELFRSGKSNQFDRYVKLDQEKRKLMGRPPVTAVERTTLFTPKIRNLSRYEEMIQHGYTELEISDEMHSREKRELNRLNKKRLREMPAYLRNEISGARRRDAKRILRLQRRKDKKQLRKQLEREKRNKELGISTSTSGSNEDDSSGDQEDGSSDNEDGDTSDEDDDTSDEDDDTSDEEDDTSDEDDDDKDNDDDKSDDDEDDTSDEDDDDKDNDDDKSDDDEDDTSDDEDDNNDNNDDDKSDDDEDEKLDDVELDTDKDHGDNGDEDGLRRDDEAGNDDNDASDRTAKVNNGDRFGPDMNHANERKINSHILNEIHTSDKPIGNSSATNVKKED
jgi:hypothetical protein